ncbi:hypothetical protein IB278_25130 [Variovorax sp. VRV01]|uniref:hypothetical protein n=1 Tax=Variovorax sp. VRV01 TaxID=2769259 RepID=UPI00177BFDC7|nr:hypothetical protein [Variovorax sp. VRV01]MBD9667267.1 hypothetical protein [Variovorax sp. VRV01]
MKMIRNKNEMVSALPLLILLIGLVLIGAVSRSCCTAERAPPESISLRFRTPLCPTIPAQELAQLAGPAHQWLRAFASITLGGLRLRSRFPWKRARAISRGAA